MSSELGEQTILMLKRSEWNEWYAEENGKWGHASLWTLTRHLTYIMEDVGLEAGSRDTLESVTELKIKH